MGNIFQELMIWQRLDDTSAVQYCCFQNVETGQYAIQSADFFRLPLDEKQLQHFAKQWIELFIEVTPEERCAWFDSVRAAIQAHERDFV